MKAPDFDELVGDEGTPEELAKLRRAHDLLVAAGPPPELSPRLAEAPAPRGQRRSDWLPRRRYRPAFFAAAAVAAAAFAVGFLVGERGSSGFESRGSPIAMHAVAPGSSAHASILIGDRDAVGNWPLLVKVSGLPKLPKGGWYELYLTRHGKPAAYCGAFAVDASGGTTVRLSVPYRLRSFDGWAVTANEPKNARPVLLTT